MEKTLDRRVIKTKKAIRNAFAKLLAVKDINDITVSDIAELADINRKTFYNYYPGIHSVIDEIENDISEAFSSVLGEINYREELENPFSIFSKLISQTGIDETTAETALTFMLYGMIAVFQSWFNSDRKRSIEDISEMISIISFKGLNGLIN